MTDGGRRLAAIVFTDIVGFTSASQRNEKLALESLESHNSLLRSIFPKHGGKEVKTIGDSFLLEFGSALAATECAVEIQEEMRRRALESPDSIPLELRIGIHLGDVVTRSNDILGDAVNLASRIQPLADPGGICVSQQIFDQVRNKASVRFTKLDRVSLKNVEVPIDVYAVIMPWDTRKAVEDGPRERNRIVVLPLANISTDPKDEFFADGMTEELIGTLSKIRGMKVVARTSAMRYKGEKKTAGDIGKELKVSSLLEGSVRRDGTRIRISLQLVDTTSEEQLWAERYDRELKDVFALQSEIAQQVAAALEVKLRDADPSVLSKQQTNDAKAYTLYLHGRYHWNTRSEEGLYKAIKCFEEAIARDPSYALARVGLGDCYSMLGLYGYKRPSTVYPLARDEVERALRIDGTLAEAHASMGEILMQYYYEWDSARSELDHALRLNPSYATAHLWKSTFFLAQGKVQEAMVEARAAEELDPLSMIIATEIGRTLYFSGKYDEAIQQYEKAIAADPTFAIAHKGLAEVYSRMSVFSKGLAELYKAISLSRGSVFILDDAGYIYALAGKKAEAEKALEDLEKLSTEMYVSPYGRAAICAALGEKAAALDWLEKAYEERNFLTLVKMDPIFESLREDPRFKSILAKVGLLG